MCALEKLAARVVFSIRKQMHGLLQKVTARAVNLGWIREDLCHQ